MRSIKKISIILVMIILTSLMIGCGKGERPDLIDFRARIDAYVNVQTETLKNYIDGKISKENFDVEQKRNIDFLNQSKEECPEEMKETYNKFLIALSNFKFDGSLENYESFRQAFDDLYSKVENQFDNSSIYVNSNKIKQYENIIKE